jgi:hypothetical protein
MTATHFSGPVVAGTKQSGDTYGPNQGYAILEQAVAITQAGVGTVSSTFYVPAGCRIIGFNVDVLTAFDSATTATLSIGTAAAGTQYVSGVNAKTAGRTIPTFTAAQLAKMNGVTILGVADPVLETVVVSVITVGATTAGYLVVTCLYAQL